MNLHISWHRIFAEGAIIVASILAALAIDAWWDERQEEKDRQALISALKLDFETTRDRLRESITHADDLNARASAYLWPSENNQPATIDELRDFIGGAFRKIDFEPALAAYESAVTSGRIGLLTSPRLMETITSFNQARDYYELHDRMTADIFYRGPIWEIRREIGSLKVLTRGADQFPRRFELTEDAYRELIASPLVYAGIEAMVTAQRNSANGLQGMDEAASQVIAELEKLQQAR